MVKGFKAIVSSISPLSKKIRSDEGFSLEMSALKLFMVANLHYQLSQ